MNDFFLMCDKLIFVLLNVSLVSDTYYEIKHPDWYRPPSVLGIHGKASCELCSSQAGGDRETYKHVHIYTHICTHVGMNMHYTPSVRFRFRETLGYTYIYSHRSQEHSNTYNQSQILPAPHRHSRSVTDIHTLKDLLITEDSNSLMFIGTHYIKVEK